MNIHPLNKLFEKIYCLNLVERPDRKEKIEKRFKELGIDVEFYDGVKHGWMKNFAKREDILPNALSVSIDHYNVIKRAYLKGYKNIFIFEDDTIFIDNFNELLEEHLNYLPDDWDMMYLYLRTEGFFAPPITNDYWSRARGACVSAYGLNEKFYKSFLDEMDREFGVIDEVAGRFHNNPATEITIKGYKCYASIPNLCLQDFTNPSNIWPNQNLQNMKTYTTNMWNRKFEEYK